MSDNESDSEMECPLCVEPLDMSDRNFLPCPCGYRVCMWCWHNIRENLNGLCPACRSPYNADPHAFSIVDQQEMLRKQKERRMKEKADRKTGLPGERGMSLRLSSQVADRRHLHNYRVIQRNLVYVIGIPVAASTEEILKRPEYFGQYGKITKIVVHGTRTASHPTVSVYITFAYKEDAKAAIQALDGFWLDGLHLRAYFGTTKYCNNFIRGAPCNNPECVYLHDLGEEEDRCRKEDIPTGNNKLSPAPGPDQAMVSGNGGPSGTGKRPIGATVLPPPVFVQEQGLSGRGLPKQGSWQQSNVDAEPTYSVRSAPPTPETDYLPEHEAMPAITLPPASIIEDARLTTRREGSFSHSEISRDGLTGSSLGGRNKAFVEEPPESELLLSLRHRYGEGRSEAMRRRSMAAAFNGLGNCAVFPVPVSSLAVSVWNDILNCSSADLTINPYARLELPLSELLELTLPPVDAGSTQAWPKPLAHYSKGVLPGGSTSAPAGRNQYKVPMVRQNIRSALSSPPESSPMLVGEQLMAGSKSGAYQQVLLR